METLRKVFNFEIKAVADRILEFVGSTEVVDRDGESILVNGWDLAQYRKNPVFMWAHDYRQPPIGRATKVWKSKGELKFHIEFAPEETYQFADVIYRLYVGGFLKATSVGFIAREWEDGDGEKAPRRTYRKQELLELSAVPVPSNPEALIQAQDDGILTIKEFQMLMTPHEEKGAISYNTAHRGGTPLAPEDTEWSASAEVRSAEVEDLKVMCTWVGEDPALKTSYKLPHHKAGGDHSCVWAGVRAAAAVLMGARGGVAIPEADIAGVKAHIARHYSDFDKGEPPWVERTISQAEIRDEMDYLIDLLSEHGLAAEYADKATELLKLLQRFTGSDIPDTIDPEPEVVSQPHAPIVEAALLAAWVKDAINGQIQYLKGKA